MSSLVEPDMAGSRNWALPRIAAEATVIQTLREGV